MFVPIIKAVTLETPPHYSRSTHPYTLSKFQEDQLRYLGVYVCKYVVVVGVIKWSGLSIFGPFWRSGEAGLRRDLAESITLVLAPLQNHITSPRNHRI